MTNRKVKRSFSRTAVLAVLAIGAAVGQVWPESSQRPDLNVNIDCCLQIDRGRPGPAARQTSSPR